MHKNATIDYQILTEKMRKTLKKLLEIFGQFVKKQYLCIRFRDKRK